MEDIYQYALVLKNQIELEYYKLKSNENFNNLDINSISQYNSQLNLNIKSNKIKLDNFKIDNLKISNKTNKQILNIDDLIINKLLTTYDDNLYGIINYTLSHSDNELVNYIINDINVEFNNKLSLIKKLIKNNTFTKEAIANKYGIIFMYQKINNQLINLNKVHLLKNGNIDKLNKNTINDTINDTINETLNEIIEDNDDIIYTKIYEFGTKIILREIITKSKINNINLDIESETELNIKSEAELEIIKEQELNHIKKLQLEKLYKLDNKYTKYLSDNIQSTDICNLLKNFTFIKSLLKKISDPSTQILDIQNFIQYNFSNKLNNIKISNRLKIIDYQNIIDKYFDLDLEQLSDSILELYDLDIKFKPYMYILFDILSRIFIDCYLENKSYCLDQFLSGYFNFSTIMAEPGTHSIQLKRRYWNQLLDISDTKKIVTSLLILLNTKTGTIDQTIKYFENIFKNIDNNKSSNN
jgi:hypothetical protein